MCISWACCDAVIMTSELKKKKKFWRKLAGFRWKNVVLFFIFSLPLCIHITIKKNFLDPPCPVIFSMHLSCGNSDLSDSSPRAWRGFIVHTADRIVELLCSVKFLLLDLSCTVPSLLYWIRKMYLRKQTKSICSL